MTAAAGAQTPAVNGKPGKLAPKWTGFPGFYCMELHCAVHKLNSSFETYVPYNKIIQRRCALPVPPGDADGYRL